MTGLPFQKILQGLCLGAILGLAMPVDALAGGKGRHDWENAAGRVHVERRQVIEKRADLHIKLRNERLPLRRILQIGPKFDGAKLRDVEISIRPRGRTTRFLLLGDGEVIAEAWSRRGSDYVRLEPYGRVRIGRDFNRLQLAIEGSARIRDVSASLEQRKHRHRRSSHDRHRKYRAELYFDHGLSYGRIRW